MKRNSLCLLFLLFLTSCSISNFQPAYLVKNISLTEKLNDLPIGQKYVYSSLYKTIFIMDKATNEIQIYANKKFVNKVGGFGFESNSFRKLSDICLSSDGFLYALDSFAKSIKKFDQNGLLLATINLSNSNDPRLLEISEDNTLYVYDQSKKEFDVYSNIDGKYQSSFGKFFMSNPQSISISRSGLSVYDTAVNKTLIFNLLGKLDLELPGNVIRDDHDNLISVSDYGIKIQNNPLLTFTSKLNTFYYKNTVLLLNFENELWISTITYEKQTN